jgi:crotonobetainyl-CoA:carnitine CoA-transferase CaiB-like acyl-CoA transferase
MSEEYRQDSPEPDEFDRQLRDLTAGRVEPAKFTELSAAERAKRAAARATPATKPKRLSWRNSWRARKLRRPVDGPQSGQRNSVGPAARRPGPTRRRPPLSARQRRIRSIAKAVGILIAFCALLVVLHLLGLGPQGG